MSLFDRLVTVALKNQKELSPLRIVVEKELLHHDILREMSNAGFLKRLTFFPTNFLSTHSLSFAFAVAANCKLPTAYFFSYQLPFN